ncbi:DNA repair protein RecN [Embleya sp. NPDC059259]|uniref:DNA repair protein RecN n=1 Tax=unclassified Embleya TaxID=2699296 RepID=UPI0036BE0218
MRIQGLGVIEDAVVELAPGFTVVTGETGAGKTMVVTGLGLLFGGRADAGLVRNGTGKALVEGRLSVPADSPAGRRAAEAGAEVDDGELLLARTVSAEGRSRAHVGGRSAPIGLLTDLADDLIAVHGQTDQQRLLRPARQRGALDRYAGEAVSVPLKAYGGVYRRLREVSAELTEITTRARERAQEADLLRFGLTEIEQVVPQPGEDAELAAETLRLGHADALRTAATTAHEALLGDPETGTDAVDASTLLGAAHRAVEAVRAHDPALAALADRLGEVGYLVSDVAGELASYAAGVDADPVRLAAAEERRAALSGLTRKYGESIDEVLAWAERSAARLAELDGDDDRTEELTAERDALRGELATLASEVSAARFAAAERFAAAVTGELSALAMPYARVGVAISGVDDPDGLPVGDRVLAYGSMGVDEVELQLSPHPGAPPRPLAKGASGGELSRVMLAVEVVFAGADPVPTFVFDEVDQGVGGKAAVEVGRRLARLARVAQVIVVTHLPQVAAFADRHLVVEKSSDGSVTRSGVVTLDDAARVRELSRMLAGLEDSELGRAHAEELLATAAGAKLEAAGP